MNRLDFAVVTSLNRTIIGKYQTNNIAVRRTCLKTRPVGAPGLQDKWIPMGLCRRRALTRRCRRVFKTGSEERAQKLDLLGDRDERDL